MNKRQRTIKREASYSGIGLHTGNRTTITFKPAPAGYGVKFVRADLPGRPEITADIDHVAGIERGTTLRQGEAEVRTVEHVLAALAGLELDNLVIELKANEPPQGDGSSLPFVETILRVGIREQEDPKEYLAIENPIFYSEEKEKRGVELVALPAKELSITFMIDYKNPTLGAQYTALLSLEDQFIEDFAPARTFCFLHEVEALKEQGLIRGGSLDNAIVIADREVDEEELQHLSQLFGLKERIAVGKTGILNDVPLRFPNEPCRHKALDLLGDLFLLGVPLQAHVLAARSGHAANVALVKKIRQLYKKKKITSRYQLRKPGDYVFDIEAIHRIMPHRYPFLLIDRILDMESDSVVAIKNVTFNESFFRGHFPGHPIMPGVLIVEAMAQAGGVLLLNTVDNPDGKLVYFMGLDNVRFRKPVVPGDQLRFELKMVRFRRGTCKMTGKAFVGDELVTEAELMATVVNR